MFRGANRLNLDAKGRLAMPTRYRGRLAECCESELVITIDPDGCLAIYPLPEWLVVERKVMGMPSMNPAARNLQRLFVGNATDVSMDGQGRVLLPPTLREFAGLKKQAMLVGQVNRFELWDEEQWNDRMKSGIENFNSDRENDPTDFSTLSF
ncbi:MAG: division/cell wall cluster transcriptional repressor MraZ [Sedimenticola sp.]